MNTIMKQHTSFYDLSSNPNRKNSEVERYITPDDSADWIGVYDVRNKFSRTAYKREEESPKLEVKNILKINTYRDL